MNVLPKFLQLVTKIKVPEPALTGGMKPRPGTTTIGQINVCDSIMSMRNVKAMFNVISMLTYTTQTFAEHILLGYLLLVIRHEHCVSVQYSCNENIPLHFGSSNVPRAKSVSRGNLTFFVSSSSCAHSSNLSKPTSFGLDSLLSAASNAAFNSHATWTHNYPQSHFTLDQPKFI